MQVWCASPADVAAPEAAARARALLTDAVLERVGRFHFARDRELGLATRALARRVLSRYDAVPPAAWRFVANAHGRPEIASPPSSLRFNLSNTAGLVVCAVARGDDVGVDVEDVGRAAPLEVAERFFAPFEVAALNRLPPERRPLRFFEYWTLKESYIKARGLGLALPLERFWFHLDGEPAPRLTVDPSLGDDSGAWRFTQLRPTARHLVALCARRHDGLDAAPVVRWDALA